MFTTIKPIGKATLEETEEVILENYKPLEIIGYSHPKELPLDKFVSNILRTLGDHYSEGTTSIRDGGRTDPGRRRSLIDIFLITRNYYPTATLKEVKDILFKTPHLYTFVCMTIGRRVYTHNSMFSDHTVTTEESKSTQKDELGFTFNKLKKL